MNAIAYILAYITPYIALLVFVGAWSIKFTAGDRGRP